MSSYSVLRYAGVSLPKRYKNMVLSRWLRSYRHGNHFIKLIDSDSYFTAYNIFIHKILYQPTCMVRMAVLTEDEDVAFGFSVCREGILDYVHIQKDYRKSGIGKMLVPEVKAFTHLTKIGMKLWPTKLPHAIFDPFR